VRDQVSKSFRSAGTIRILVHLIND